MSPIPHSRHAAVAAVLALAVAHPAKPPAFVVSIARSSVGSDALYRTDTNAWIGNAAGVDPAYSPTAHAIAFDHPGPGFADENLYVVGLDGSGQHRLGIDAGWFPTWSPDGTRIATACRFTASHQTSAVCITDLARGAVRTFVRFPVPHGGERWVDGLAWSPDGSTLAVVTGMRPPGGSVYKTWPQHLLLFDVATKRATSVATVSFANVAWSRNASQIVFWRGCDIVVRTLRSGRERRIRVQRCDDVAEGPIFLGDDGTVDYALRTGIEAAPLDGGPRRRIVRLPHVLDGGADLITR